LGQHRDPGPFSWRSPAYLPGHYWGIRGEDLRRIKTASSLLGSRAAGVRRAGPDRRIQLEGKGVYRRGCRCGHPTFENSPLLIGKTPSLLSNLDNYIDTSSF